MMLRKNKFYYFNRWVSKRTFAYYQKHNTYKDLPRRWEVLTSFCNGYASVGQKKILEWS